MLLSDEENLLQVDSTESVDQLNARFYARFPYPWPPMTFDYLTESDFERWMLSQDVGDWDHSILPPAPRIWIAGCGTNQAVYTALKFPQAQIIGSDLSVKSLEVCGDTARKLGVTNLELRRQSINDVDYHEEFDYVMSTGVIHHNADPREPLRRIAAAVKPDGLIELMVYNRYHSIIPTSFQKAVRILADAGSEADLDTEMEISQRLIDTFSVHNSVGGFLRQFKDAPPAMIADRLFQPVERSYTVESFSGLLDSCDLDILAPVISRTDQARQKFRWNLKLDDPQLQRRYDAMPDVRRWHVANLLLLESSPMIWFYAQRRDSSRRRQTEREMCEAFLNREFVRASTTQRSYMRRDDGSYRELEDGIAFPGKPTDPVVSDFLSMIETETCPGAALDRLGIEPTFQQVNEIRLQSTTSAFSHLQALPVAAEHQERRWKLIEPGPQKPGLPSKRSKLSKLKTVKPQAITLAED